MGKCRFLNMDGCGLTEGGEKRQAGPLDFPGELRPGRRVCREPETQRPAGTEPAIPGFCVRKVELAFYLTPDTGSDLL